MTVRVEADAEAPRDPAVEVDDDRENGGVGGSPADLHGKRRCVAADARGAVPELIDVSEQLLLKFIKERIRVVVKPVAG